MKLSALICAATLAVSLHAQGPTGFVDSFIVKVKPEKRADFDVIGKKIAEANRKHKGSNWIAYQTEYGEQNTVSFSSLVDNYAGFEKSADAFGKAMMEAYGPTFMKIFQDANNCMVSSRSELRRRRADLSWNVPGDPSEIEKMVGQSRWLRVLTVRVRAGHTGSYEEVLKALKASFEKGPNRVPELVSQSAAGTPSGIFYVTTFGKSMADYDPSPNAPPLREILGARGYATYMKSNSDDVNRFGVGHFENSPRAQQSDGGHRQSRSGLLEPALCRAPEASSETQREGEADSEDLLNDTSKPLAYARGSVHWERRQSRNGKEAAHYLSGDRAP
jgi:hypothetical protein